MVIRNIRPIVSKYLRTYCSATGLLSANNVITTVIRYANDNK